MSENFLRLEAMEIASIELENQNGPLPRTLLTFHARDLFPGSQHVDLKQVKLVFDDVQLATLRDLLLELKLPEVPNTPGPSVP